MMMVILPIVCALALMGAPLFIVMSAFSILAFMSSDISLSAISIEMYRLSSAPTILTIPLFTLAGHMMAKSKSPERILNFAQSLIGHLPGGVPIMALMVCAFFTAFTGASGVTIIALGGLLYPILKKSGGSDAFSLGLVTTSGSLGLLFPPSLPIILYGLVSRVDIDHLFLGGILPGMLIVFLLSLYSIKETRVSFTQREKFSWVSLKKNTLKASGELFIPIFVLSGLYSGTITITEAAAFTALYVFILEVFIHKEIKLKTDLPAILIESATLVASILLILCSALAVTNYLVDDEVPQKLLTWMKTFIDSPISFLLFLNVLLLIVGSIMDIFSAIIIIVPLIIPMSAEFGIHPVHLAMIFLTNLEIGYLTPPVGINLFIASNQFKRPIMQVYSSTMPFLLVLFVALMIVTYVPFLSTAFLP